MPKSKHRKNHKQKVQSRQKKEVERKNKEKKEINEKYRQIMKEMERQKQNGTNGIPNVRMPENGQEEPEMLSEEDIQSALSQTENNDES